MWLFENKTLASCLLKNVIQPEKALFGQALRMSLLNKTLKIVT